ncbi:MAG: response regulator transcription factor [Candidatus Wallbacteria bacterium]|nr:response regulator transcription factor [Candidatus Wallbacteria bacterium]
MPNILLIEDDPRIAAPLVASLQRDGYRCSHVTDGSKALRLAQESLWDLVLLDLMLPGLDGISICHRVRERSQVPILILTARDEESDKLLGLEVGADDYVTKPFSLPELKARIRALLRRAQFAGRGPNAAAPRIVVDSELSLDAGRRKVWVRGTEVEFMPTEFDLLLFLVSHPGQVFTRSVLLDRVWHYSFEGYERTVGSHVTRIRKKVEAEPSAPSYILTVHRVGYKFREAT